MAIKEVDLPEATRRNDVFNQLLEINKLLSDLAVFPSLLWAWAFDIIKDIYDNNQIADLAETDIYRQSPFLCRNQSTQRK